MASASAVATRILFIVCIVCIALIGFIGSNHPLTEGFSNDLPKTVWSYWHDPVIPPSVASMLEERQRILTSWNHIVLNEITVYEYIDRTAFPKGYDSLSHQHKADWIRLYILRAYGGCWMDASIIVNSGDELETLYKQSVETRSEFTGFYLPSHTLKSVKETYIENWFIMAPKQSKIIQLWYEEYTTAVEIGFLPYKKRVFSKIDVSNIYGEKEDDSVYLTQHASLQYVLRVRLPEGKNKILLFDASDTMFKPHIDCNWDTECTLKFIKETPKEKQPPYIKLRSTERNML